MKRLAFALVFFLPLYVDAQTPPTGVYGIDFTANNGQAVSAVGHLRLRYNTGTGQLEQSVAGGAYTGVGGSLQQSYTAGGTNGGAFTLTAAGGGLIVRDNNTPLGTALFGVTDSTGASIYFSVLAAAVDSTVAQFDDGQSAAVSVPNQGYLRYNDNTHRFEISVNGGGYAPVATGSSTIGLKGSYVSASTTADNVILLSSTFGPIFIRNNGTPLVGSLFGVQDVAGSTKYLDVAASGTNIITDANGGGSFAQFFVDKNNGAQLGYNASFIKFGGNQVQLTPNVAGGSFGTIIVTPGGLSSTGAQIDGQWGSGNVYFSCGSGASNIGGLLCEDITADTNGTTANLLVAWSSADKVQIPAASANLHTIAGVALTTKTTGQASQIMRKGRVAVGCDTGGANPTMAVGDLLVSSGTNAGRVITNNAPAAGTVIGKATEACTSNSTVIDLGSN